MRDCEIDIAYGALYCDGKPEQYDERRRESGSTRALHRPVRRNKCVCVEIAGVVAVAIAFVPGALLEEIEGQ
jgi:hypothetical protein